jgi:hypothetical protein
VACGGKIGYEVLTSFIANGSTLKIKLKDGKGKVHLEEEVKIYANHLVKEFVVPVSAEQSLTIEAELPDHGLKQVSKAIPVAPRVEIRNAKWNKEEAERGDIVFMSADIRGLPDGYPVEVVVLEHDLDGAHDFVTKIKALVDGGKIQLPWEFRYIDDTDDILSFDESKKGYRFPTYFFRVSAAGIFADSNFLSFNKDWITFKIIDNFHQQYQNIDKINFVLADGSRRTEQPNNLAEIQLRNIPPGKLVIETIHFKPDPSFN